MDVVNRVRIDDDGTYHFICGRTRLGIDFAPAGCDHAKARDAAKHVDRLKRVDALREEKLD